MNLKLRFSSILFLLFLIIFTGCQTTDTNKISFEVSAQTVNEKIKNNEKIELIDVRTAEEYEENHISNSLLLPLDQLEGKIATLGFEKDDEIILYCRSGRRSSQAYQIFIKHGFTNVKSMTGGITEWNSLGNKVCVGQNNTC
jgi:rhodanese-related sulfurtransferase